MWKHNTTQTIFCLYVDDFGIKFFNKEDAQHLLDTLGTHYTCTVDWAGINFYGLTLEWDYDKGHTDVSMPDYVKDALKRLQPVPSKSP